MNGKMYVRPATNDKGQLLKVADPKTGRHLPIDGAWVPRDTYWARRVRDHSVIIDHARLPGVDATAAQSPSPSVTEIPVSKPSEKKTR